MAMTLAVFKGQMEEAIVNGRCIQTIKSVIYQAVLDISSIKEHSLIFQDAARCSRDMGVFATTSKGTAILLLAVDMEKRGETVVMIIGAGPSGLAVSACLSNKNIPHIILEKEDCIASLWRKRAYARLHLHLAKEFCALPLRPHSPATDTYMSKDDFIRYLHDYVIEFNIVPRHGRFVKSALFIQDLDKWHIEAMITDSNKMEAYASEFLVVASGENSKGVIPSIPGLENYRGVKLHSSDYKNGSEYEGKDVLVVGGGNSGMEISLDLANYRANCSIVVHSPLHVLTREMIRTGMYLLKCLRPLVVDFLMVSVAKHNYRNLEQYGIFRPRIGPFMYKQATGKTPTIEVGTVDKIKMGQIKVLPAISTIKEHSVVFQNGAEHKYDAIIFATGYESTACEWLKNHEWILKEDGMPKKPPPFHWKGENRIYCAGLSRMGLAGISKDASEIANDITAVRAEKHIRVGKALLVMAFVLQVMGNNLLLLP
ncbi:hypothetical protein Nepgr_026953 [Nepenthes gracilis]|uniref:Flavin-containing monooxygenase n=1 Tax=Nepenthes gracilis TaxID=150966 RepID=A0AAD3Y2I2_NEPGR|nr:hypothetical protein Nepgr_026953 [Nepenthes gracilis]